MSKYPTGYVLRGPIEMFHGWNKKSVHSMYALRDSDLPLHTGRYYSVHERFYACPDIATASVWRYRKAAETYRNKYFPRAEVVRVETLHTGQITNDGRMHLRAVNV